MDLLLALCQAIGLGLALGIGGPLAWLFVAVMAGAGIGLDPEGTDWEFVGSAWFIVLLFAANVADFYLRRREPEARPVPRAAGTGVLGGIFGAAALAAEGEPVIAGFLVGAIAGFAAALLATALLAGAQRRATANADVDTAGTLTLIFAGAGVVTALLALLVPPAALLALVGLAVLARGRRRRAEEKYEGLRVLR